MMEWKRIIVTTSLASNPIACIRNWSILTKNLPRTWLKINWNKASSCYQSRGLLRTPDSSFQNLVDEKR